MTADPARFQDLTFDGFKDLARDETLTPHERIGFPDSYREGKSEAILDDVASKLTVLSGRGKHVLDIGPGCGELALRLIDLCRTRGHKLALVDSREVLARLPDAPFLTKIAARFPEECAGEIARRKGTVDAILSYSVLQYVHAERDVFAFLDAATGLLAHGGAMLIGDIPNLSKRRRFLESPAGVRFHRELTGRDDAPPVPNGPTPAGAIDDEVLLALVGRARSAGFDAYLMPQAPDVPLENRREDLLVRRP
jgi:2-polyprenyl-3-methyl-5-hydroxy-6-metoxy-1,4-benzoquinol methylase